MLKLSDRHWGHFKIGKILHVLGNGKNIPQKLRHSGPVPFIGVANNNNGIVQFIQNKKDVKKFNNFIGVNGDGAGGVGYAFYHNKTPVYCSSLVRIIDASNISKYTALFISTCIRQQRSKYNYGFKLNKDNLINLKINLPINNHNKPDWLFMNKYIKQILNNISNSYIHNTIHNPKSSLKNQTWKLFKINDIGKILSSKDYPKKDRIHGKIPYIGRTRFNNGVTDYINKSSNTPKSLYKNVIAVNRNGSTGYAFYHASTAYFSGGVRVLSIKKLNRNIGLFISTCIRQQRHQFSYGYELGKERLNNLKINLPVDSKGSPNWKFMDNYIESIIK